MLIRSILLPTDYAEPSKTALNYATELARDYGARLVILHAVETLGPENITFGEATSQPQPEAYRRRLWDELHHVVPSTQLTVEYVLSEDDPVTAILQAAANHQCDLIVLGTHGRTGMRRFLEGSIAEQVVRLAQCPVLVVKSPSPSTTPPAKAGTTFHPHELTEH
jgi:nucleotide-binding universal stress UspA family protein